MNRFAASLLLAASFLPASSLTAQGDKLAFAAGSDEDRDLQAISSEADAQKKLTLYQDFVKKYSANPAAVAYGNWQISQAYQTAGDLNQSLDYGDKALASSPHNLDIIVSQASLAQQSKNNGKLLDYAARGGEVCSAIGKNKPADMSDDVFARQVAEEKTASQSSCDFLESSGFNVIVGENDPKARMADIEKYTAAFPASKFGDQVSSYAMYTLGPGQLNDSARLVAYGEKTLATNPNSLTALLLLANFYSDDPKPTSAAKAATYAQKAIEVAKPDAPDADDQRKISAGIAHSTLGYADIKQSKLPGAIAELQSARALLKGRNEPQYAIALYRLGVAYAKAMKTTEAREVLMEAVKIAGPTQAPSQDLLTKVNAARAKGQ